MELVSVNVSLPRRVLWKGSMVETGIFKEPVAGRVALRRHQLDGDGQADPSVHGGPTKAAYAYPAEHYPFWREQFPDLDSRWGLLGENLTTRGLLESDVCIGDHLRVGSAVLVVTEPRMPCYKLGIRFGRADAVKRFQASERSGFYLAVEQEGDVASGDAIERIRRDPRAVSVTDIVRLRIGRSRDVALLRRSLELPALPEEWKQRLARRLAELEA